MAGLGWPGPAAARWRVARRRLARRAAVERLARDAGAARTGRRTATSSSPAPWRRPSPSPAAARTAKASSDEAQRCAIWSSRSALAKFRSRPWRACSAEFCAKLPLRRLWECCPSRSMQRKCGARHASLTLPGKRRISGPWRPAHTGRQYSVRHYCNELATGWRAAASLPIRDRENAPPGGEG